MLANWVIRGTGLVLALLTMGVSIMHAAPIDVGDRKQLFIDQRFIAESEGVEFRVNPPVKRGCILRGEGPWENGYFGGLPTVLDDGTGEYKLYYGAWPVLDPKELTWQNTWDIYSSCLATSTDGIHWEKPNLGLVEYNGSTDNNILPLRQVCHHVFLDPNAPPEQRYKLLFFGHRDLIRGNRVHYIVTWHGKDDLSALAGQAIKLHFELRNAKLYAFQFHD